MAAETAATALNKHLVIAPFPKLVEIGRVCLLKSGAQRGKIVTIVDVIDARRYLVEGPEIGVPRRAARANEVHLTKFVLKFPRGANTKAVREAWKVSNLMKLWSESNLCKKLEASKKRAELTDLDRFKLYLAKQRRNRIVKKHYFPLLKKSRKEAPKKTKKRKHEKKTGYTKIR